jgi:hypothetical protein
MSRWKRALPAVALMAVALVSCASHTKSALENPNLRESQPAATQPAGQDLSPERAQLSTIDSDLSDLNGDISSADAGIDSTSEGDVSR